VAYTLSIEIKEIGVAMKAEEFRAMAAELEKLTPHQRNLLTERLQEIGHVQAVHTLIESRALAVPVCPKCGHDEIALWGSASGLQRYRCAACKATFNALTGTPLARLRHKDKWLDYAQQMVEGQSVRKSAKACDVHRNTAFRWRHRFLTLPDQQKATSLVGIAEVEGPFFLEPENGCTRGGWIADLLPNDAAPDVAAMMEQGLAAMKRAMEGRT